MHTTPISLGHGVPYGSQRWTDLTYMEKEQVFSKSLIRA